MSKFLKILFVFFLFLPVFVFAQAEKKKALLFYSESCSHCQEVEDYFQKENIYDKYEIRKIDVAGEYNAAYLNEFFDSFNIAPENRGWPAVFFGNEILVGSRPIMENFVSKIEKANASEFPAPATVEKSLLEMKSRLDESGQSFWPMLYIILNAGIADSINPCVFVAVFILLFILWPSSVRSKFPLAIIGFFLAIFISRLFSGIFLYYNADRLNFFRPILAMAGILSATLGIFSLKYSLRGLTHALFDAKIGNFSIERLTFIKGMVIGVVASIFLLPNSGGPYFPFIKILSERLGAGMFMMVLSIHNFLFIIPLLAIAFLIYRFSRKEKVKKLYRKSNALVRVVCGAAMVLVGIYIVRISF